MTHEPKSYELYKEMTEKQKEVFKLVVTHMSLYGCSERNIANTLWDIIRVLLGNDDISDEDFSWFVDFWNKEDELKTKRSLRFMGA